MTALFATGVAGNQHAGGIEPVFAEKANLRSAHTHVGPMLNGLQQGVEPVRPRNGVIIERRQIRGCGGAHSLIDGSPKPRLRAFSITRASAARPLRRTRPWPLLSTTITSKSLRDFKLCIFHPRASNPPKVWG